MSECPGHITVTIFMMSERENFTKGEEMIREA